MIKVDLVTGFLGSGKTTFIKKYAGYLMDCGNKIGILENDHGAINVDMLILNDLRGDNCELEMVAGGCDSDCHRRRFKTKLISMAMCGYTRVIVEPSGIFDIDEFFDILKDDPLDSWYEIGNVFCIADINVTSETGEADYLFASQMANAGKIILSHMTGDCTDIQNTIEKYNEILLKSGCKRELTEKDFLSKSWDKLSESDFEELMEVGYVNHSCIKKYNLDDYSYETQYYMNSDISPEELEARIKSVFSDDTAGRIYRIKGFAPKETKWCEFNFTGDSYSINESEAGQNVFIVIGENLNKKVLDGYFLTSGD